MRGVLVMLGACSFSQHVSPDDVVDDAKPVDAIIVDVPQVQPCLTIAAGTWCRRRAITIDTTKVVGGPHAGFPLLVVTATDTDLAMHARTDGFDLLFTDANGGALAYERELFVKASGQLVAWVRIPSLANGVASTIYLYYGNASAGDQQTPSAVWDAGYQAVLHLGEGTGGTNALRDSTTRANHGTNVNGGMLGVTGTIGRAFRFDGTNDRIRQVDSASLDSTAAQGTFETWIQWTDASSGEYQFVLSNSNWLTGNRGSWEWASQPGGAHYFYPWRGDTSNYNLGPIPFADGTWHHAAVTYQSTNRQVAIYVDGVAMTFTTTNCPTLWTTNATPADWLWGGNPDLTPSHFGGALDEIRISNVVRSAAWLATEHVNQAKQLSMMGAVEVLSN